MSEESSQTETTVTATAATSTVETVIYVGPNIPNERLNRYSIYKNGLPTRLDDLFTACPAAKKLLVAVDKLADVQEKISKTGTSYNIWYNQVLTYLKKKG